MDREKAPHRETRGCSACDSRLRSQLGNPKRLAVHGQPHTPPTWQELEAEVMAAFSTIGPKRGSFTRDTRSATASETILYPLSQKQGRRPISSLDRTWPDELTPRTKPKLSRERFLASKGATDRHLRGTRVKSPSSSPSSRNRQTRKQGTVNS